MRLRGTTDAVERKRPAKDERQTLSIRAVAEFAGQLDAALAEPAVKRALKWATSTGWVGHSSFRAVEIPIREARARPDYRPGVMPGESGVWSLLIWPQIDHLVEVETAMDGGCTAAELLASILSGNERSLSRQLAALVLALEPADFSVAPYVASDGEGRSVRGKFTDSGLQLIFRSGCPFR